MTYFNNPLLLWLLFCLPLLGLLGLWSAWRKRRTLARLGNVLTLQRNAASPRWRTWTRRMLLTLGLLLVVVGSAGPRWGRAAVETVSGRDIVVVLDLSRSMLAEPKSRQERAITALLHLCNTIEKRGGHRLALLGFAARPEILCPLTHDYDHFRFVLEQLSDQKFVPDVYPRSESEHSGTRIGAALVLAVQLHDATETGARDILLLSDGDDPGRDEEWTAGIAAVQQAHIPVDIVGVGDPDHDWTIPTKDGPLHFDDKLVTTRLNETLLQAIAAQTRGTYLPLRNRPLPLGKLYYEVLANRDRQRDNEEGAVFAHQQRFVWFLGPALGVLVLSLLLGDGRRLRRRTSVHPTPSRPQESEIQALAG
jgi:Ca-activated chloride channel family protein